MADVLVGVEGDHAFAGLDFDRQDLVLEAALLDRAAGAQMAGDGEFVLLGAADLVAFGEVFGGDAHQDTVEWVIERAVEGVEELGVTHFLAPARGWDLVGGAAHAFDAAGDRDLGLPRANGVGGGQDRLQAAAAQAVDGERRGFLGQAALDHRDTRNIHVARLGLDHLAEHGEADLLLFNPGAANRLGGHLGDELAGRDVLEGAAEGADGGTHAGDDVDLGHSNHPP